MPRFGGIATMMRLPFADSPEGLDAAFIGVPLDIGTSNRAGARFGPRQIRAESSLIRPYNMATGAAPFDTLQVADLGDVPINTFSIEKSMGIITGFYERVLAAGCKPLTMGGDHTIALPILRALAKVHGPLALVHVDAHADINDAMFGEPIAHGTPFRRAVEEGLLACDKVWQIGLRGTGYTADDFDWPRAQGFTVVQAHEIGGLTVPQGLEIVRGCGGLNVVGGDLVEVAPPYDPSGNTALLGANLLYEMLCVLPGVRQR